MQKSKDLAVPRVRGVWPNTTHVLAASPLRRHVAIVLAVAALTSCGSDPASIAADSAVAIDGAIDVGADAERDVEQELMNVLDSGAISVLTEPFRYEPTAVPGQPAVSIPMLELPPITLAVGEAQLLRGRARIRAPATLTRPVLAALKLACTDPLGVVRPLLWTLANWEPGVHPGGVDVSVRDALVADRAGVYRCRLEVMSGGANLPDIEMEVLPGAGISELAGSAAVASTTRSTNVGASDLETGATTQVLERIVPIPPGAAWAIATGDVQTSSCFEGSVDRFGCGQEGSFLVSRVVSQLRVAQLAADGSACATSVAPSPAAERDISNPAHHAKLSHAAMLRLVPGCGDRLAVVVRVSVAAQTNPIHFDLGSSSSVAWFR